MSSKKKSRDAVHVEPEEETPAKDAAEDADAEAETGEGQDEKGDTSEADESKDAADDKAATDSDDTADDDVDAEADEAEPELTHKDKADMLQEQLEVAADKYLRLRADMDNFRKRKIKEMDDLRRNTKIATLEEVLPVMDQFQMAVDAMNTTDDVETIKHGMELILNSFNRCFENLGVDKIETKGKEFDHNLHEAIATEPSDEVEADHVISEWKAGYKIGDYLLRPAVVVISSGPKTEAEDVDDDKDSDDSADAAEDKGADAKKSDAAEKDSGSKADKDAEDADEKDEDKD